MKRRIQSGIAATMIGLALAACSNGSDHHAPRFNSFVEGLIQDTADDTDPVAINGQNFSFSEDEHAFDDLFQ